MKEQEIITKEEADRLMEEDKEAEDEIRARNLRIGAGAISFLAVLLASGIGFTIYKHHNSPKKSFHYKVTHDGKIQVSGRVKFKEVKENWYLFEKELNNGEPRLYIVDQRFFGDLIDIHTDQIIGNSVIHYGEYVDETILNMEHLEPYLITYDMVYDSYTIEDMDRLLGLIEENYEYTIPDESEKVMMKTPEQTLEQTID